MVVKGTAIARVEARHEKSSIDDGGGELAIKSAPLNRPARARSQTLAKERTSGPHSTNTLH